jgi:hypothetical protein
MIKTLTLEVVDLGDARLHTRGWGQPLAEIHPTWPNRYPF